MLTEDEIVGTVGFSNITALLLIVSSAVDVFLYLGTKQTCHRFSLTNCLDYMAFFYFLIGVPPRRLQYSSI